MLVVLLSSTDDAEDGAVSQPEDLEGLRSIDIVIHREVGYAVRIDHRVGGRVVAGIDSDDLCTLLQFLIEPGGDLVNGLLPLVLVAKEEGDLVVDLALRPEVE